MSKWPGYTGPATRSQGSATASITLSSANQLTLQTGYHPPSYQVQLPAVCYLRWQLANAHCSMLIYVSPEAMGCLHIIPGSLRMNPTQILHGAPCSCTASNVIHACTVTTLHGLIHGLAMAM